MSAASRPRGAAVTRTTVLLYRVTIPEGVGAITQAIDPHLLKTPTLPMADLEEGYRRSRRVYGIELPRRRGVRPASGGVPVSRDLHTSNPGTSASDLMALEWWETMTSKPRGLSRRSPPTNASRGAHQSRSRSSEKLVRKRIFTSVATGDRQSPVEDNMLPCSSTPP